jgi:c-di-AMP phosphodiesterase-like protein
MSNKDQEALNEESINQSDSMRPPVSFASVRNFKKIKTQLQIYKLLGVISFSLLLMIILKLSQGDVAIIFTSLLLFVFIFFGAYSQIELTRIEKEHNRRIRKMQRQQVKKNVGEFI